MMVDQLIAAGLFERKTGMGLQVAQTQFYKDGRPFKGIGLNHFSLMLNRLMDMGVGGISLTQADVDLRTIKQTYGLPFVRFSAGAFSRSSWMQWYNNKPAWYAALDAIVASAENRGVGLMPVLIWDLRSFSDVTFDIYGSFDGPSKLADTRSNAWDLVVEYITEVVTRYKNSPAIWAWCVGNEIISKIGVEYHSSWAVDGTKAAWLNWGEKPGGGSYAVGDKMSRVQWTEFSRNVIELIRSLDDSGRAIFSGSAIGNSFAVNAQSTDTFTADTLAQWNSAAFGLPWVVLRDQSFETLTQHIYPQSLANSRFFNGAEKTQSELIALSKSWADAYGKAFFLEEFGATYHGDPVDETSTNLATEQANFAAALSTVVDNDVQLSAVWNYDGNLSGGSHWMRWKLNDAARLYQLEAIAQANAAMQI